MEKIKKQVMVNLILVIVSVIVIFIAKTVANDKVLVWKEYLGTDIIFVMITSLVTTVGWRFSENIIGHWLYNIIIGIIVFFLTLEYGIAMVKRNSFILNGIIISMVVFLVFYLVENLIIIFYFRRAEKSMDKLTYNRK